MPYRLIEIPPHVGPRVAAVVRTQIDPRFSDVHSMLRLPIAEQGLEAGCNFAIVDTLFGILEGAAAVLWPRDGDRENEFRRCVETHYRSDDEPGSPLPPAEIAGIVRDLFRNPMRHTLGLSLSQPDPQTIRWPISTGESAVVMRDWRSPPDDWVESLVSRDRPAELRRPTLTREGGFLVLVPEAFYRGTRRLVDSLLADTAKMRGAEIGLEGLLSLPASPATAPNATANAHSTMVNSGTTMNAQTTDPQPLPADWLDPPDAK